MTVTAVQKNKNVQTGTVDATPPAWGSTTTAGNLLLVIGNETAITNGTWPTSPAGYTAVATTPMIYWAGGGVYGIYYKIAAGGDATPGHYGENTSTQNWQTYTYEFSSDTGWDAAPLDKTVQSAASSTAGTSKASGSTATLAQANEMALVVCGLGVAVTALSFTGGFTIDNPASPDGRLWVGWQEVAATTALASTASWTTSSRSGCRIATFKKGVGGGGAVKRSLAATGVGV